MAMFSFMIEVTKSFLIGLTTVYTVKLVNCCTRFLLLVHVEYTKD